VSAVTYGYNHVPVTKDPGIVAGAFEDVDDIKLLCLNFLMRIFNGRLTHVILRRRPLSAISEPREPDIGPKPLHDISHR
jgi:hypothetical protein